MEKVPEANPEKNPEYALGIKKTNENIFDSSNKPLIHKYRKIHK